MAEVSMATFKSTFLEVFITANMLEHVNTDIVQQRDHFISGK